MQPDAGPPIQLQQLLRRKKPALKKRASLFLGLALLLLALTGCSQAGPQPTPEEQRLARTAAPACEGLTPVFQNGSLICHKDTP